MSPSRKRYQRALRTLETLEPRTLMSATAISSYGLPNVAANYAVYDDAGALWVLNTANTTSESGRAIEKIITTGTVHSVDTGSTILLDLSYQPVALVGGIGNIAYLLDSAGDFGGIDVVDLSTGQITQHLFATSDAERPLAVTQTPDGAAWFVGTGAGDGINGRVNVVGRMNTAGSVTEFTTLATNVGLTGFGDAQATAIAPSGDSSVWIGFSATVDSSAPEAYLYGTDRIGEASYDGTAHLDHLYTVNSGNATADHQAITSIVDGGGSVWFTLANDGNSPLAQSTPDLIVKGVVAGSDLNQSAYTIGTDAGVPLTVTGLNVDVNGAVWFIEFTGTQFGKIDGSGVSFENNPTDGQMSVMTVNAEGTQLSIITLGSDPEAGYGIVQIDVEPDATTAFHFLTGTNVGIMEDTPLPSTDLATFTGPDATYTATIKWGDGTTTTVPATPNAGHTLWTVTVSGKVFATQGTFNGTVSISDGVSVLGSQNFTSTVGDTPLNVTSFTVTNLAARVVVATGTFFDDADLPVSTWTATVTWENNVTSKAVILRDPTMSGRYLILAVHAYRSRYHGQATLKVISNETGGTVLNSTLSANVNL